MLFLLKCLFSINPFQLRSQLCVLALKFSHMILPGLDFFEDRGLELVLRRIMLVFVLFFGNKGTGHMLSNSYLLVIFVTTANS